MRCSEEASEESFPVEKGRRSLLDRAARVGSQAAQPERLAAGHAEILG